LEVAKVVFFAVYVAATIGVIVGVYWEGDRFPKEKQQRGWSLLIRSLAADTLFTILIFGTDGWIGQIQRVEIISLEERLLPRDLTIAAISHIEKKICPFGPQQIDLVTVEFSEILFLQELSQIWRVCHWTNIGEETPKLLEEASGVTGIHIRFDAARASEFGSVSAALATALMDEGIEATAEPVPSGGSTLNREHIHIIIGSKP
jgi:hypothetical protein